MISGQQQSLFVREFTRGATYKTLALMFGRDVQTMRKWRQRFGLPPRQRKGFPSKHKTYVGFYLDKPTADKLYRAAIVIGITKSELLRKMIQRRFRGVKL